MNAALGVPRAYVYPTPRQDEQVFNHPLERNTSFYLQCCFVNQFMHMPLEQYLRTTSRTQQKLDIIWHHLYLLKEAYANSTKEQRAKFPA